MRICILGKTDVPVCSLAGYLVEKNHEVHLVSALEEQSPPSGVVPHRFEARGKLDFFLAAGKFRRLIDAIRPDVIHAFFLTSYGYLASRIPSAPVLATAMGTDVFGAPELSRALSPFRAMLVRRAIRRADHLHSVSTSMTERLIELGADPVRISTFPRGVSLSRFAPRKERSLEGPVRWICNRRLEPVYDHETLLRAAASLRRRGMDFRLEILGRGTLDRRLRSLVSELSLDECVFFGGQRAHAEMPDVLSRADVFLSSSLSDGTSSCLLEAMASGCVPVVSDIAANRPWIRDGDNGFLFRPGDPASLAGAIERSIAARAAWSEIGIRNRERIRVDASLERGCERVVEIYRRIQTETSGSQGEDTARRWPAPPDRETG